MRIVPAFVDQDRTIVSAARFLYKLCGSSQPSIIQGTDGNFYVVKFKGFPGHQALANEAVGSDLIRMAGLPAPSWSIIDISEEFISQYPSMWFLRDSGDPIPPHPGLHFASRLIEAGGDDRTYQTIPHSWNRRITNRKDFLGILTLDLWANNCDRRQAVYLADAQNILTAQFIDNDYMFGGKYGFEVTSPRRVMAYDLEIYSGLWTRASVQRWLQIIDGISDEMIRRVVYSLPDVWASSSTRWDILNQLRARRSLLPRLLDHAQLVTRSGHSDQFTFARNATEPGSISLALPKSAVC